MAAENKGPESGQGGERSQAGRGLSRRGTPFTFLSRVFDETDRMFERLGLQRNELFPDIGLMQGRSSGFGDQGAWAPQIETFERNGQFIVRADLPGLTKDDVKVELGENTITLEGERRSEREASETGSYRSERSYGSFYRTIPLPEGVTGDDASASFSNGVLEITMKLPRKDASNRRRIDIQDTSGQTGGKSVH